MKDEGCVCGSSRPTSYKLLTTWKLSMILEVGNGTISCCTQWPCPCADGSFCRRPSLIALQTFFPSHRAIYPSSHDHHHGLCSQCQRRRRAYAMPESPKPIPVKVESETRPNFMKLKEIERKRREILLRVSLL